MHRFAAILFFVSLAFVIPGTAKAQTFSSSAELSIDADYQINGVPDLVFLFHIDNPNKFITVSSPNSERVVFEWSVYNTETFTYDLFNTTDTTTNSQLNLTQNAGYAVRLLGNGIDTTIRCWTLINNASVEIVNAELQIEGDDTTKVLPNGQKWCHLLRDIRAEMEEANLFYYHPVADTIIPLTTSYSISWSDNPDAPAGVNRFIENDNEGLRVDVQSPFWEDSWYIVSIEDNLGFAFSDSIFCESIEPHAEFDYEYIRLDNKTYYPESEHTERYYEDLYGDEYYGEVDNSAPALFRFDNLSVNADTMIWYFGDEQQEKSDADSALHLYMLPGTYQPKLIVYNYVDHLYDACTDTFPTFMETEDGVLEPIIVEPAQLGALTLPNVFEIDGSGERYFRFLGDASITDFEIAIYNRYGKRVHHYSGNIRDWQGWDGSMRESDRKVGTGVYYYVVKEVMVLPDIYTGVKPKLVDPSGNSQQNNQDPGTTQDGANSNSDVGTNSIFRGFVHVYNTQ